MLIRVMSALLIGFCLQLPGLSRAAETTPWEVGLRVGYTFDSPYRSVEEYDLFVRRNIPSMAWDVTDGIRVGFRGEASVGALHDWNNTSFIGSLGPALYIDLGEHFKLHGGTRVTILGDQNLGHNDFGGIIQFTSHGGISYAITPTAFIGYQYQHMSNGSLYVFNPGLNLNSLEVGIRF